MFFSFNLKRIQWLLVWVEDDWRHYLFLFRTRLFITASWTVLSFVCFFLPFQCLSDEEKTSRSVSRAVTSATATGSRGSRVPWLRDWRVNLRFLESLRFEVDPLNWQFPGGESLELRIIMNQCPQFLMKRHEKTTMWTIYWVLSVSLRLTWTLICWYLL